VGVSDLDRRTRLFLRVVALAGFMAVLQLLVAVATSGNQRKGAVDGAVAVLGLVFMAGAWRSWRQQVHMTGRSRNS
jgi:hypothetical protein